MHEKTVLITGGAGFIGSHLADHLVRHGYQVRVLDCLTPEVHEHVRRPAYLDPDIPLVIGDVRDRATLRRCLVGTDFVIHLAARVDPGKSMYQIDRYTKTNNNGTAILLESLVRQPVRRLVVASSMSIYGEGLYRDADGHIRPGPVRTLRQLQMRNWEPVDEQRRNLVPVPTPETKPPSFSSVYALSKFDQEQMCLVVGSAYDIPTVALRLFSVYGTRQAPLNPSSGALARFASRLLAGERPVIFEDGRQSRDFVHVSDVAEAFRLALEAPDAAGCAYNIGSGTHTKFRDVAARLARAMNRDELTPEITQQHRRGDVRHCFADISLARRVLRYEPRMRFDRGLAEFASWIESQPAEGSLERAQPDTWQPELTV